MRKWEQSETTLETRASACRPLLDAATNDEPVEARKLAAACHIQGSVEYARRRIRDVVQYMRKQGVQVGANSRGYFIQPAGQYATRRRGKGRTEFATARKFTEAVSDRNTGQLKLIETSTKPEITLAGSRCRTGLGSTPNRGGVAVP